MVLLPRQASCVLSRLLQQLGVHLWADAGLGLLLCHLQLLLQLLNLGATAESITTHHIRSQHLTANHTWRIQLRDEPSVSAPVTQHGNTQDSLPALTQAVHTTGPVYVSRLLGLTRTPPTCNLRPVASCSAAARSCAALSAAALCWAAAASSISCSTCTHHQTLKPQAMTRS